VGRRVTTGVDVCAVDDLPDGEHRLVDIGGGIEVAVYRIDGEYFAIEDVCTHDYGQLADGEVDGHQVICPRHGARFDLRTGEALTPPAYRPVDTYPVRVNNDRVVIDT
jgi:3-phenylpropionate/trans-cinnamate dioxygenase ferredoxin subunit